MSERESSYSELTTPSRIRYVPAVGPRLAKLLAVVFGLVAVLGVNSVYLASITLLEWSTGRVYQNHFYQSMFLVHLVLGLLLILPVVIFGGLHIRNARNRPNRRAIRAGYALFVTSLALLASGLVLMRLDIFGVSLELRQPMARSAAYWVHVAAPLVAVWLFILHRLAGRRIRWRVGLVWAGVAGGFALAMVLLHAHDPRSFGVGPREGERYFFPSLARTASGGFIPEQVLVNDAYCVQCHADVHERWSHSAHRFSSFNNPAYLFSVLETRRVVHERDGHVRASRFCAGCHDPVPFFSGAFDQPKFDDPTYDLAADASAQAGITCTVCHAITHINSPRGNADYTIEEPTHYPFATSENPLLQWINRQLVKAKPAFHKKTFLKPLHKSAEFCGTCHKVHLPEELNAYKWLRGQNHYDSFLLSGVSGHGVESFYYPPTAETNCNGCHMPLRESTDFGARFFDDSGALTVHDHLFPSANTALPHLLGRPDWVVDEHRQFNEGVMRLDLFGVKEGGTIDGPLTAPIRPAIPTLEAGKRYLLETVIRTVKMGHLFTQGTADSNEVWLEVTVTSGDRVIGRSGGIDDRDGRVDPWSHFVNAYVIDREGRRIDRRNAQDIFLALYDHQIPPGAADVVHYRLDVPDDAADTITVDVKLRYRKFDTTYMEFFQDAAFARNDLPILTLAHDRVTFPTLGESTSSSEAPAVPEWQRWNDYGIGLLRKGESGSNKGELRQAEAAFEQVERLGRPDGSLNRARVYLKEGRLTDAVAALQRAAGHDPPAPAWSVNYFSGLVDMQNGRLDAAIENFLGVVEMDSDETRRRGFDFSKDYRLLNQVGLALFERGKQAYQPERHAERVRFLREAVDWFERAVRLDPENVTAHYNLSLLFAQLDDAGRANHHQRLHARYKVDDNAGDRARSAARRRDPAANHAAEAVVIYDLQRPGAFGLPPAEGGVTRRD